MSVARDAVAPLAHDAPLPRGTVARTLVWLYVTQWRNRLRRQLARLRQPRYLVAMLVGVAYLWWALFSRTARDAGPFAALATTSAGPVLAGALLLVSTARWWLSSRPQRGALTFTPAELHLLFPAPVSRRALVHAKLLRSQAAILLSVLVWTVLLRADGGTADGWRRGLALWLVFATATLHALGAALVRLPADDDTLTAAHAAAARPGTTPRRWRAATVVPRVVFAAMLAALAHAVVTHEARLLDALTGGPVALLDAFVAAMDTPAARVALAPVRWLVTPIFASGDVGAWMRSIGPALLVFAAHYAWVLRLDTSFEEAAFDASRQAAERTDRARRTRLGAARSERGRLARIPALPHWAPAAAAITWKNVAAAIRAGAWRQQLALFFVLIVVFGAVGIRSRAGLDFLVGISAAWGAMLVIAGPLWTRFDLRMDLPQLAVLRALPLRGRAIVTAEIAASTLLQTVALYVLGAVPVAFVLSGVTGADARAAIPIMLAVAIVIPGVTTVSFVAHNGLAVLFPSWARLGSDQRGFEAMGQNVLTMAAGLLGSATAAVVPFGLAFLVALATRGWFGDWHLVVAAAVATAALLAEMVPVIAWLGDVFDRTDPADVAADAG